MEPVGMSDQPENQMLVFLRRLDTKMDRLADDFREVRDRLTSVELGLAGVRRDIGGLAEADARMQVRIDRLDGRLERIEKRLDLIDA
jgi:predicted  nucleic acid-binding Zn-ribbon protein